MPDIPAGRPLRDLDLPCPGSPGAALEEEEGGVEGKGVRKWHFLEEQCLHSVHMRTRSQKTGDSSRAKGRGGGQEWRTGKG